MADAKRYLAIGFTEGRRVNNRAGYVLDYYPEEAAAYKQAIARREHIIGDFATREEADAAIMSWTKGDSPMNHELRVRLNNELTAEIQSWREGSEFRREGDKIIIKAFGHRALGRAINRAWLSGITISATGTTITIECDDHDTKDALLNALTQ